MYVYVHTHNYTLAHVITLMILQLILNSKWTIWTQIFEFEQDKLFVESGIANRIRPHVHEQSNVTSVATPPRTSKEGGANDAQCYTKQLEGWVLGAHKLRNYLT